MLAYIMGALMALLSLVLFGWLFIHSLLEWLESRRRAGKLLRSVLTREQYCQLLKHCYVDIKSPSDQERFYRVPRYQGMVGLIEKGRHTASLCLQPLEWVPDADIVVIHKLMIEADEETYLQTANRFATHYNGYW